MWIEDQNTPFNVMKIWNASFTLSGVLLYFEDNYHCKCVCKVDNVLKISSVHQHLILCIFFCNIHIISDLLYYRFFLKFQKLPNENQSQFILLYMYFFKSKYLRLYVRIVTLKFLIKIL